MEKIKRILLLACLLALFYTRFVNLSWGLPYPFHPDERNMANAVQSLSCEISNCLNPHFFAYGQFPLYLSYFGIQVYHLIIKQINPINFFEATVALRSISAISSIFNVFILLAIVKLLSKKSSDDWLLIISLLVFTFSPGLIQFAHFGTTESLLMLFYSVIIYLSLLLINKKITLQKFFIYSSLFIGLATATKASSVIFVLPIIISIISTIDNPIRKLFNLLKIGAFSLVFFVIFSPYNFIAFSDFLGSMRYESDVALGNYLPFYTRQFTGTIPLVFQFQKIFPYSLGWPILTLFILGLFFLSWKNIDNNFLRLSFLSFFLPSAFIYAKWTRFMAPVMPIMLVIAVLFLMRMLRLARNNILFNFVFLLLIFSLITPGLAFLSIYTNKDIRFTASDWIFNNIPMGSYILSETANVVDLPVIDPSQEITPDIGNWNSKYVSFNFYDLDKDAIIENDFQNHLKMAEYIFIPSRRVFYNHKKGYPILNKYYEDLFMDKLGFKKVAEFTSYPKIEVFGKKIIEFPDEAAEETWTVFDHPVFRIYKRET